MKITQFKTLLNSENKLRFVKPDGTDIPHHFHITEAGLTTKQFVDCGGTVRTEKKMHLQLWVAEDLEHRLSSEKLKNIIQIAEKYFTPEDIDIEVEYSTDTIGRYEITAQPGYFQLQPIHTDCLAKEQCGVPIEKRKVNLAEITEQKTCCTPGSVCC